MLYVDYEKMWEVIRKQEQEMFELINEREEIFNITQPKATTFDKEKVDGFNPTNINEKYIAKKDYLDKRIEWINRSLDDRYQMLNRKRTELRLSKNTYDRIYVYRVIEKLPIRNIAMLIPCDRATVYRYMSNMCKEVKGLGNVLYSIRTHKQD